MTPSFRLVLFVCLVVGCGSSDQAKAPLRVLGTESQNALSSVTHDPSDDMSATIVFSPVPSELANAAVGDNIILPPTKPTAENGLLYKINSIQRSGSTLTIQGTQPPLADVVGEGEGSGTMTLSADNIDVESTMASILPGLNPLDAGLGPTVSRRSITLHWPRIDFSDSEDFCQGIMPCTVSGHVIIPDPQFHFELQFDLQGARHVLFRTDATAEIAMDVTGYIDAPTLPKSFTLASIHFTPIVFTIGVVPIYLQPRVEFDLGIRASFAFNVDSAGFAAGVRVTTGFDHNRGVPDVDLSNAVITANSAYAMGFSQITLLADIFSRVDAGCYLYDVSGPFQYIEQGPQFDVGTPRHPFMRIGYHISTGAGYRFAIDHFLDLLEFTAGFYDHVFPFFTSSNSIPVISLFTPTSTANAMPGEVVPFVIDGYDVEDGPVTDSMVTWSSSLDGVFGNAKNVSHAFFAGGPGIRQITATVTDSDGGMAVRTTGLILPAVAPTIALLDPQPTITYFTLTPYPVTAQVTSSYFPGGDFCTASGSLVGWKVSGTGVIDASAANGCTGTVSFPSPGSYTLTFTGTDRFGQTAQQSVTVNAVAAPTCNVSIIASPGTDLTNSGGPTTVTLTAVVAAACPSPGFDYFAISSTANGGYHEKVFPNGQSVMYTPSTDLADDGFLMVKNGDTSIQTIDVNFTHSWDFGAGNMGSVTTQQPLHLHYQWH